LASWCFEARAEVTSGDRRTSPTARPSLAGGSSRVEVERAAGAVRGERGRSAQGVAWAREDAAVALGHDCVERDGAQPTGRGLDPLAQQGAEVCAATGPSARRGERREHDVVARAGGVAPHEVSHERARRAPRLERGG
jgi:hypothetical protein